MKILVNCSTLVTGGGVQVGVGFIMSTFYDKRHEMIYLVSPQIYRNLSDDILMSKKIILVHKSPGTLAGWVQFFGIMKGITRKYTPDLIYSIGFPSYYKFSCVEIGRYTNPWDFFPEPLPWHVVPSVSKRLFISVRNSIRRYFAQYADYIETQTEFAKESISNKLGIEQEVITVISNSINPIYYNYRNKLLKYTPNINRNNRDVRIFCLSADYPHKNLLIIPYVAHMMVKSYGKEITFVLTLSEDSTQLSEIMYTAKQYDVSHLIVNEGVLKIEQCVEQYRKSSLVFLPTLLEIFSATYLESMAMDVPIVTSDLGFARGICGDAAVYIDPNDPYDCAKEIYRILNENDRYISCIQSGRKQFENFPLPDKRIDQVYEMFRRATMP